MLNPRRALDNRAVVEEVGGLVVTILYPPVDPREVMEGLLKEDLPPEELKALVKSTLSITFVLSLRNLSTT